MGSMTGMLAALVLLTTAAAARGAGQLQVEQTLESANTLISAGTATGSVSVRECVACPRVHLNLTTDSKFFAGGQELSFGAFTKALSSPQPRSVSVYYRETDKAVTRIVIDAL